MQRSVLDKIYLSFLAIMIISFGIITVYTAFATRKALVNEKINTLTNEATLIATQTITEYEAQRYSKEDLEEIFKYYSETLKADIWYVNKTGIVIATSGYMEYNILPKNVFLLDQEYLLDENFSTTGDFYGTFSSDVVTINVPITVFSVDAENNDTPLGNGALILHTKSAVLTDLMSDIYGIIFIPSLFIIIIAFVFLGVISKKVIQPIRKLNSVANEYAKGNFEVKTDINTKDEIGQLAGSLETMATEVSKVEEYRRDFISNISHDFRSPLTSIKGYIEAMLDGTIPVDRQERYLKIVLDETKRLTKLTTGLLDMNKLERSGMVLTLSDFDALDMVKKTINTFEIKCIEKNVPIYLTNLTKNAMVTADKTKIQQVFYNLIDNALKFTPDGCKITVTISETDEKIIIKVLDEGIGMDEDTQKKIWLRFFKRDASRGKDKQGTGLGLAISKEIMKAHEENIEVKSQIGAGSEFTFTLKKKQ